MAKICSYLSIKHDVLTNASDSVPDMSKLEHRLKSTKYTNVSVVHSDTGTGVINPVRDLGSLVKQCQPGKSYLYFRDII